MKSEDERKIRKKERGKRQRKGEITNEKIWLNQDNTEVILNNLDQRKEKKEEKNGGKGRNKGTT